MSLPKDHPNACPRCWGDGRIASGEEGAPWPTWLDLPLKSATAVIAGIVKPIPCPICGGSGSKERDVDLIASLEEGDIALEKANARIKELERELAGVTAMEAAATEKLHHEYLRDPCAGCPAHRKAQRGMTISQELNLLDAIVAAARELAWRRPRLAEALLAYDRAIGAAEKRG